MKIGLDFHGVIDNAPEFFDIITNLLIANSFHEIHIITGLTKKDVEPLLEKYSIAYTHLYSITDDLLNEGLEHIIDNNGRPCFSGVEWSSAKAVYCKKNKIDIMLDDSDIYGKYFITPYFKMEYKSKRVKA